jgi:protein-tyrosine phosphatase
MAEAIFRQMVADAGLSKAIEVDSAGTGSWHVGEKACSGTRRVLAKHGYQYNGRARQVTYTDMSDPDGLIIAMSSENIRDLQRRFGDHPRLHRLLDFATDNDVMDVPDPYYEGNFDYVYQLVEDGCRGLLEDLRRTEKL